MKERGTQQGSSRRTPWPCPSASWMVERSVMGAHDITAEEAPQGRNRAAARVSHRERVGAALAGEYAGASGMAARFLAFDLGAESGRAIAARLDSGVLALGGVSRFPNGPVRLDGSLRWDAQGLWSAVQAVLEATPPAERP